MKAADAAGLTAQDGPAYVICTLASVCSNVDGFVTRRVFSLGSHTRSITQAEVLREAVEGELVAQLGGRVLVGVHALLPDRLLSREGLEPLHAHQVLRQFRVVGILVHGWRLYILHVQDRYFR